MVAKIAGSFLGRQLAMAIFRHTENGSGSFVPAIGQSSSPGHAPCPRRCLLFITWPDPGAEALVRNKVVDAFSVQADGNEVVVAMRSKSSRNRNWDQQKVQAGTVLTKRLEADLG